MDLSEVLQSYDDAKQKLEAQGMGHFMQSLDDYKAKYDLSPAVKTKDNTLHYIPYYFGGSGSSGFELDILKRTLTLTEVKDKALEIYYNGERGLTEFVIHCYAKDGPYWKNIGKYTTDFLMIKRNKKSKIHKALLIETKGAGFAHDEVFKKKRAYVETEFLQLNREKFGYNRFDFLYLQDSNDIVKNLSLISQKIQTFFND